MAEDMLKVNFNEVSAQQMYLKSIIEKFNENKEHPDLSDMEKAVLAQVLVVEKEVEELAKQGIDLSKEIEERQGKISNINQQILVKKGQSQGLVDALLATKKV